MADLSHPKMTREGENKQQSCEVVMDRMTKQRAWGHATGRDYKTNKRGLSKDNTRTHM